MEPACTRPPHTSHTLSWQVAPDGTLTQKLLSHRVCLQAEVVLSYKEVPPISVRGSLTSDLQPTLHVGKRAGANTYSFHFGKGINGPGI